jgi:hypothetical protein
MAGVFRTGLDYAAMPAVAGPIGVTVTPDVLSDLKSLELGAIDAWSRKR